MLLARPPPPSSGNGGDGGGSGDTGGTTGDEVGGGTGNGTGAERGNTGNGDGGTGNDNGVGESTAQLANGCQLVDLRPLHVAAAAGHVALVELLLRSGAELEALDAKKDRALHKACGALAKPAGDPKAKVPMATDECERRNARLLAVVQALIGAGAALDAKGARGKRAVDLALAKDATDVVQALVDAGAKAPAEKPREPDEKSKPSSRKSAAGRKR